MPLALPLLLALPALQAPAPSVSPAADAQSVLDAARAKARSVMEARAAFMKAGGNSKDFHGDCTKELADLDARLKTETRPEVRQALLVSRLLHLQLMRVTPDAAVLDQLRREVPPTSAAWSLDPGLIEALADEKAPGWGPYLTEARTKHPDPAVRRYLLFEYFWDRLDAKDEAAWKPAYDTLQMEFPGTREAKQAAEIREGELKTGLGRPAPAFSLPALGDPKTTYTLASFKGKYLLIDFWATWCPPCRAEMPNLHKAWARFKGRNFEILSLSFDRKVEHIAPFRKQAATPMPWDHAFVEGGFNAPVAQAYGVKGIPKPLLISPEGVTVASGSQLRGEELEKTLAKFLGK
jgi:thiol-disulfide isomerase/thioredoxin